LYGTQIYENIKINSRDPIFIMIHGGGGRENLVNTIYIYIFGWRTLDFPFIPAKHYFLV
jgi:hypothetical protein